MKWICKNYNIRYYWSHPARGGWIEIAISLNCFVRKRSRPARGGWIEIRIRFMAPPWLTSRPARGGWIEMWIATETGIYAQVSPREGRVD